MSDNLRDAAERLRRLRSGEDQEAVYEAVEKPAFCSTSLRNIDRAILADAWLAEHPADSETPFTCQWLVDVGASERRVGGCLEFDLGDITLHQHSENGIPVGWVLYLRGHEARMSKCPKTRGDVRLLCRALGIPLKETP